MLHGESSQDDLAQLAQLRSSLLASGALLGLLQQDPEDWFSYGSDIGEQAQIQALVDERIAAKKARDFARADAIRAQLNAMGVVLEDTPSGPRIARKGRPAETAADSPLQAAKPADR